MLQRPAPKYVTFSGRVRALVGNPAWRRWFSLAAILSLSAFLNLFGLAGEGYGNPYYAATVKSMLTGWHDFFFVSFDAGFVSVDKPPLGLWVQAASAKLLGFYGWSLLLPQALAGVLSVALLYHLVRRAFGPTAGLVASLALAVTPISVVTSRNNTMDSLLILTVLVAAWAVVRAVETGRLRWLLAGAFVVGLGFNIKMLEAYLVLPAFYLLYLVAAPVVPWRRFVHLGAATLVLLVVSLSWAVAVDLTPPEERPYVGDSSDNTVMDLIFGWNGVAHLMEGSGLSAGGEATGARYAQQSSDSQGILQEDTLWGGRYGPGGVGENGERGPIRLFNEHLAGQIGWLLPLAIVGLLAAGWRERPRLPLDRRHQALMLWGTWLLTMYGFFSVASMFHRYYLVMLAPAVAALVGAGVVALWNDYRGPGWRGWLLPLTLLGMAALHAYFLAYYPDQGLWLAPVIVGLCLVAAGILAVTRLRSRSKASAYPVVAASVGVLALLVAPTVWVAISLDHKDPVRAVLPFAGPDVPGNRPFPSLDAAGTRPEDPLSEVMDPRVIDYLQANQGSSRFLLAASNASSAPIILQTDEPVISIGGFTGSDPVLSADELADLVERDAVRFFLVPDRERMAEMASGDGSSPSSGRQSIPQGFPGGGDGFTQNEATTWVQENCEKVPRELWRSSAPESTKSMIKTQALYDCGAGGP